MTGHAASKRSSATSMRPYLGSWLKQKRQHPVQDPIKGRYLYPLWLRLWHWVNALLFFTLIVTGISLHYADIRAPLIPFNTARLLHNSGGILISLGYLGFLVANFFPATVATITSIGGVCCPELVGRRGSTCWGYFGVNPIRLKPTRRANLTPCSS